LVHPFVQDVHQLPVPVLFQTPSMAICLLARAHMVDGEGAAVGKAAAVAVVRRASAGEAREH